MLNVKLIVIFVYIINFNICSANYCEICTNHTLCLYSSPGPNTACKLYDVNALLTEYEIHGIVNSINERRNFIAMGLSRFVPRAANMRKILWSSELATVAQRWVDQCDPTTQPDKEDQCRDLAHTKVGQNIASIFGPTRGLNIKSFVELWFIPILKYRGSVSYYNQSKAHGTDYFTQLIWAETEFVGCGKARFYDTQRNMIVERLVCNFAPKGNIHGKPIYAVGYPSTQCPNYMIPDRVFPGLCTQREDKLVRKPSTTLLPVTSLLRIVNLSNNSMKQDIDPLRNYLKQMNLSSNKTNERRNQKMRHVFFNNTHGGAKRIPSLESRNFWNIETNNSYRHKKPIENGHSRVYHGHESRLHNHGPYTHDYDFYEPTQNYDNEEFRRHDFTGQTVRVNTDNTLRKYNGSPQCTRKHYTTEKNCETKECSSNICTRGEKHNVSAKPITSCLPTVYKHLMYSNTQEKSIQCNECPCIKQTTTCSPNPKHCTCNVNCHCLNTEGPTPNQNIRSTDLSARFSYGFSPNIVLRSGDQMSTPENSSPVPWLLSSNIKDKSFKSFNRRRKYGDNYKQVKDIIENPKFKLDDSHYYHNYFDSSERKKRELDHPITFKPFWQMEEFNYKKPSDLKSIRYTTLGIRKGRKSKRTSYASNTESITISLKEFSTNNSHRNRITEKYLSFEELMRLRKMTSTDRELDVYRRLGNDNILRQGTSTAVTTSSATTTSEYTTNTPFIRKKHCTRKLTCTWTAFAITGADGNTINPWGESGSLDHGSRTPSGYVEGCSRTSTCTREFMDRNQMASITEDKSLSGGYGSTPEDGDYCERRSLDIRKRDIGQKSIIDLITVQQTYTPSPTSSKTVFITPNSCSCNKKLLRTARQKRDIRHILQLKYEGMNNLRGQRVLTHSELICSTLDKIKKIWFHNKTLKSSTYASSNSNLKIEINFITFLLLFIVILN